jgi:hypothetical protein
MCGTAWWCFLFLKFWRQVEEVRAEKSRDGIKNVASVMEVVLRRFELRQAVPKTAVLPLHHKTILRMMTHRHNSACKVRQVLENLQIFRCYFAIIK